jgi:hypothetical protein
MTIHEPMTLVTDYLLGGVTAWLWLSLHKNSEAQWSRFCWRMAFLALALGAFLGGTWHGFFQNPLLWKATVLSVGIASFFMVAGSATATLSGVALKVVLGIFLAKLLAYAVWMQIRDDFVFVVIDTEEA